MSSQHGNAKQRAQVVFSLLALVLVGVSLVFFWRLMTSPTVVVDDEATISKTTSTGAFALYVGSDACAECHPGPHAYHAGSGHARTLRAAGDRILAQQLDGRLVSDPEWPGVEWQYRFRSGELSVERIEGGERQSVGLDYAFGSGHHATTFLSVLNPDPRQPIALEHRLTHYSTDDSLAVTPGQRAIDLEADHFEIGPLGYRLSSEEMLKCFRCHTTMTSGSGRQLLDVTKMIPNVSCERCHGPGRDHLAAAHRGIDDGSMQFGIGNWTSDSLMNLCGQCHRHPDTADPEIIRPDNPELARFQPVGTMQSRCYTESHGSFSCVTCHNPHDTPETASSFYEAICLNCHAASESSNRVVSTTTGCLECHMPGVDSGQKIYFTDHWIRVRDEPIRSIGCTRP